MVRVFQLLYSPVSASHAAGDLINHLHSQALSSRTTPPLTHNIDTTNQPHVRLVTSSHSRRHSSLHTLPSPLLVVAHSSLTTSRSLTGRGRRRCYPATIQYPGERRSKHCVRRRAQLPRDHAGVGDDVDSCSSSSPHERNSQGSCVGVVRRLQRASEHNSRGDPAQHAGIVDDVDYSVAGSRTQLPRDPCRHCNHQGH